jgi:polysaccharide biosynthesis protein PslH
VKIAFLSHWCPYPLDTGSRIRQYYLLRYLAEQHEITLFTFLPAKEYSASLPALRSFCQKVIAVPYQPYTHRSFRSLLGFLSPLPRSLAATYSPVMAEAIRQETRQTDFDVFMAGEIACAQYVESARAKIAIFDDPELAFLYDHLKPSQKWLARWRYTLTQIKQERFLRRILNRYDGCSVVSLPERDLLNPLAPPGLSVEIVPNGVDTERNHPGLATPQSESLVFSGSLFYSANWDAVDFFLRDIFPSIRAHAHSSVLTVTGNHNGLLPGTLASREKVTFSGFVEDVRPLVAGSAVAVVPLRQGAGTRLKVLEAMALGTPVVSTSKGVQGLDAAPGQHVLVADTPDAFAQAVVSVLQDPALRQRLAANARRLVETRYDWRIIGAQMSEWMQEIIARKEDKP